MKPYRRFGSLLTVQKLDVLQGVASKLWAVYELCLFVSEILSANE